jgi:hypothetical protein
MIAAGQGQFGPYQGDSFFFDLLSDEKHNGRHHCNSSHQLKLLLSATATPLHMQVRQQRGESSGIPVSLDNGGQEWY